MPLEVEKHTSQTEIRKWEPVFQVGLKDEHFEDWPRTVKRNYLERFNLIRVLTPKNGPLRSWSGLPECEYGERQRARGWWALRLAWDVLPRLPQGSQCRVARRNYVEMNLPSLASRGQPWMNGDTGQGELRGKRVLWQQWDNQEEGPRGPISLTKINKYK